jgi:hypothetical protein
MVRAKSCTTIPYGRANYGLRYMSKGRHVRAFQSMCRLRFCKVQAARDQFYMHKGLEAEHSIRIGQSKLLELVTVPRNRRALIASELVMFMQQ